MPSSQRVQASFKVSPDTKNHVDLLASALNVEKSRVIEDAVAQYLKDKREHVGRFLDAARQAIEPTAGAREKRR